MQSAQCWWIVDDALVLAHYYVSPTAHALYVCVIVLLYSLDECVIEQFL